MHWDCAPREKKAHQKQGKMTNCAPRVKEKCVLRKAHWNSGKRTRTCAREDIRIVHWEALGGKCAPMGSKLCTHNCALGWKLVIQVKLCP